MTSSGIQMLMKTLGINPEQMMQDMLKGAQDAGIGQKLKLFADQVDRIERKLDLVIDHFGLVDDTAFDPDKPILLEGNQNVRTFRSGS